MASFGDLVEPLAADLAFLNPREFIIFRSGAGFVQVIQHRRELHAEVRIGQPIRPDERAFLVRRGWEDPVAGRPTWLLRVDWPLSAEAARRLAVTLVDLMRSYVAEEIQDIEYVARNYDTWESIDLGSLRDLRRADDRDEEGRDR